MIYNDGTFEDNKEVWFVGYEDNCIYRLNMNNEIDIISKIPTENSDTYRMNSNCIKYLDKIICLPNKSHCIYFYDMQNENFSEISLQLDVDRYSINNAWVSDNVLWCLSYRSGDLIKCDIFSGNYEKIKVCDSNLDYASGEAIKISNYIYIIHRNKCMVTKFEITTGRIDDFKINCNEKGFGTISYANNNFYLTGYKKNIYIWNEEDNNIEIISLNKVSFLLDLETDSKTTRFFKSKIVNDYLVLLTQNNDFFVSDDIVLYNYRNGNIHVQSLSNENNTRKKGEYLIYQYSFENDIFVQDYKIDQLWKVNLVTHEVSKVCIKINKEKCEEYWKNHKMEGIQKENDIMNLEVFLKQGVIRKTDE